MKAENTFKVRVPKNWNGTRQEKMARMRRNLIAGYGLVESDEIRFTWDATTNQVTVRVAIDLNVGRDRKGPKGVMWA